MFHALNAPRAGLPNHHVVRGETDVKSVQLENFHRRPEHRCAWSVLMGKFWEPQVVLVATREAMVTMSRLVKNVLLALQHQVLEQKGVNPVLLESTHNEQLHLCFALNVPLVVME